MRNLMIFAAVLVGLGTYMAQMADKMSLAPAPANASPQKAPAQTVAQASGRSLDIPRDARGHFQADGRIDGQRVNFMIDTRLDGGAERIDLRRGSACVPRAATTTRPSPPPTAPSRPRARGLP